MFNKLTITSNNPDFKGQWLKDDVEKEMAELDIEIEYPNDWINYIFNRVFVDVDEDIWETLKTVATFDTITEIKLKRNGIWARITKEK